MIQKFYLFSKNWSNFYLLGYEESPLSPWMQEIHPGLGGIESQSADATAEWFRCLIAY